MEIREAIDAVVSARSLTMDQAAAVMRQIMQGEATPAQLASFLTALRLKGESTEEIAGMATVMREFSLKVQVEGTVVDSVGTGGDGANTFNISTAAALVAAGAGVRIAKHGNRAASGSCGAADVLETLGVRIELPPEGVERCINDGGIGFMFAQAFHPSMRHAGPVRREIGIRTVFNILGPLTNPAAAQRQLIGVAYPELGQKVADVMRLLGSERSLVVHGAAGSTKSPWTAPRQYGNSATAKSKTGPSTPTTPALAAGASTTSVAATAMPTPPPCAACWKARAAPSATPSSSTPLASSSPPAQPPPSPKASRPPPKP